MKDGCGRLFWGLGEGRGWSRSSPIGSPVPQLNSRGSLDLMPRFLADEDEHTPCITKCVVPVLLIINLHTRLNDFSCHLILSSAVVGLGQGLL